MRKYIVIAWCVFFVVALVAAVAMAAGPLDIQGAVDLSGGEPLVFVSPRASSNTGTGTGTGTAVATAPITPSVNAIWSYVDFNPSTGVCQDSSGRGRALSWNGGAKPTLTAAGVYMFPSGAASIMNASGDIGSTTELTIAAKMSYDTGASWGAGITKDVNYCWQMFVGGSLRCYLQDGVADTSTGWTGDERVWVWTISKSANQTYIYRDGISVATNTANFNMNHPASQISVGNLSYVPRFTWKGIAIYSEALNAATVATCSQWF